MRRDDPRGGREFGDDPSAQHAKDVHNLTDQDLERQGAGIRAAIRDVD
jgi:hypothetical protein